MPGDPAKACARICLGTVKLGCPEYGFSSAKIGDGFDPVAFLYQAEAAGIRCFDTSPRYGGSEEILGRYLARTTSRPQVSSKIDNLTPGDSGTPARMLASVRESLSRLNLARLDICYLHQNELEVISDPFVHEGFQRLQESGLIGAAGASLYSFDECEYALGSGVFDVIQVPVSVFDLGFYVRFIRHNRSDVRFVARSVLLQGILVNRAGIEVQINQPDEVLDYLERLDRLADQAGLTTLAMALGFVASLPGIDNFLIGTTSLDNLRRNLQFFEIGLTDDLVAHLAAMAGPAKLWTNPRNWRK